VSAKALYVETSALLRVLFQEAPFTELAQRIDAAERLATSRLTRIECARALRRVARERRASDVDVARAGHELALLFDRVEIVEISAEIGDLAERVAPDSALRSLDAIHLASWQLLRRIDPDLELLTADQRLATAAGIDPVAG
jgi:predicted nucleic acid-binding protein